MYHNDNMQAFDNLGLCWQCHLEKAKTAGVARGIHVKHVSLSTARQAQVVSRAHILLSCKYCWDLRYYKTGEILSTKGGEHALYC